MKYILLYNDSLIPKDIFDIILYIKSTGNYHLIPENIFIQKKNSDTLILVDYEDDNNTSDIIVGQLNCIKFLSEQSVILHLKDKSQSYKNKK